MINSVKVRTPILALILFVFTFGQALAADPPKVVVIPMAADAGPQSFAVFADGNQSENIRGLLVVRTVSLTAPTDGVVIVNSSVSVADHLVAGAGVRCSISVEKSRTAAAEFDYDHEQNWISGGAGSSINGHLGGTRGFNAVPRKTMYYRLTCQQHATYSTSSFIVDSAITATFTPSS